MICLVFNLPHRPMDDPQARPYFARTMSQASGCGQPTDGHFRWHVGHWSYRSTFSHMLDVLSPGQNAHGSFGALDWRYWNNIRVQASRRKSFEIVCCRRSIYVGHQGEELNHQRPQAHVTAREPTSPKSCSASRPGARSTTLSLCRFLFPDAESASLWKHLDAQPQFDAVRALANVSVRVIRVPRVDEVAWTRGGTAQEPLAMAEAALLVVFESLAHVVSSELPPQVASPESGDACCSL